MSALRVKGGAWHVGWRWKVWAQMGEWGAVEAGLGRFWLFLGRLSLTFDRNGGHEGRSVTFSIAYRRPRSPGSSNTTDGSF